MSDQRIRVYRQDHTGSGVLVSEHTYPSSAIRAAIEGKKNAPPSLITANVWWVAFPIGGGRWDCWFA